MTAIDARRRLPAIEELLAIYPTLPPAERRVADVILGQPRDVLGLTSSGLAAEAKSSQPATSRLCSRLTTKTFAGFKVRLAQELGLEPSGSMDGDARSADENGTLGEEDSLLARMLARTDADLAVARRAVATLDVDAFKRAAAAIRTARSTVICGFNLSGSVAWRLASLIYHSGYPARSERDPSQVPWLDMLSTGDILLVISYRGQVPQFIPTVRHARSSGAMVIVLTNEARTELAELADILLLTRAPASLSADEYIAGPALYVQLAAARALWMAVIDEPLADRNSRRH
jgi:DNA-binding MurR/RpiR family transcriptional regulator